MKYGYLTVLNTDNYLPGVLVLDRTLREHCVHRLTVLVSDTLRPETYAALDRRGIPCLTAEADALPPSMSADAAGHAQFGHWVNTFFKLKIFGLTQFDKLVFVDCDMMVLGSIDEVFDRPDLSAVIAGRSYPGNEHFDNLNSGFMVLVPREGLPEKLSEAIPRVASRRKYFGDQDVIGAYFSDWIQREELHLPESYNVFIRHYGFYARRGPVKAVHFIGRVKPWMMSRRALLSECFKHLFSRNGAGIPVLLRYRRYLREEGRL